MASRRSNIGNSSKSSNGNSASTLQRAQRWHLGKSINVQAFHVVCGHWSGILSAISLDSVTVTTGPKLLNLPSKKLQCALLFNHF